MELNDIADKKCYLLRKHEWYQKLNIHFIFFFIIDLRRLCINIQDFHRSQKGFFRSIGSMLSIFDTSVINTTSISPILINFSLNYAVIRHTNGVFPARNCRLGTVDFLPLDFTFHLLYRNITCCLHNENLKRKDSKK